MQGCKLRSGVNWPGSLKQNGIKKGLVYCNYSFVTSANLQEDLRSRSSNCQGLDLKVVKAHWSKSWSDSLVPKETMCIVIWSSLFFRFQKEGFSVYSFLQMVKNVPLNSLLVMHSLNERVVNIITAFKENLLVWVACIKYLFDGWWLLIPIWTMLFELWSEKLAVIFLMFKMCSDCLDLCWLVYS